MQIFEVSIFKIKNLHRLVYGLWGKQTRCEGFFKNKTINMKYHTKEELCNNYNLKKI